MHTIRVLHICLPHYDNLGDIIGNASIGPMLRQRELEAELVDDDIWLRRQRTAFLDERIDEINHEFDLVMIGPGGFLGPKLIGSIFTDPTGWDRLKVPLVFNGVGIVASINRPVWYSAMDSDTHVVRALSRANAASVRELNSWLLAARAMGAHSSRLWLSGCPSLRLTRLATAPSHMYDLALNLSFVHEVCRNHIPALLSLATAIRSRGGRVLWVCHSTLDASQAAGVNRQLGLGFEIVRPGNAHEAGTAYASCRLALVTRFHAGIFCLANSVPFAFIGYDVKCWHLLTMLADEPYQYLLPIDRLAETDVETAVHRVLARLEANEAQFRKAERLLVAYFDAQSERFLDGVIRALGVEKTGP
jgi:hypothetical protein